MVTGLGASYLSSQAQKRLQNMADSMTEAEWRAANLAALAKQAECAPEIIKALREHFPDQHAVPDQWIDFYVNTFQVFLMCVCIALCVLVCASSS